MAFRVVVVLDVELQNREQQQADRPVEVDQPRQRRVRKYAPGSRIVGVDDVSVDEVAEQRLAVVITTGSLST